MITTTRFFSSMRLAALANLAGLSLVGSLAARRSWHDPPPAADSKRGELLFFPEVRNLCPS
jgi:hypothetical protein